MSASGQSGFGREIASVAIDPVIGSKTNIYQRSIAHGIAPFIPAAAAVI
jgi:hypothetical protein